jgi:nucleoside-diphosphate-sugar epimerase
MKRSNPAFVTGACGFIGRHLVRRLLTEGRPVIALCRRPDDLTEIKDARLDLVVGALEDSHAYDMWINGEVSVFHLAAVRNIPGNPSAEYERVNVEATLRLGRLALKRDAARFVHVSTALVYGPGGEEPRDETSDWDAESSPSLYIRSRAAGQRGMAALAGEGLQAVIVCPTLVYGPDHPSHPNRLTTQVRRLLGTRLDVVVGNGEARRNLVAVEDVIEGMLLAEESGQSGESFILGGEDCSHRAFNREVLTLSGRKPALRASLPTGLVAPLAQAGDRIMRNSPGAGYAQALRTLTTEWTYSSRKAEARLGYRPRSLQEGLEELIVSLERERGER